MTFRVRRASKTIVGHIHALLRKGGQGCLYIENEPSLMFGPMPKGCMDVLARDGRLIGVYQYPAGSDELLEDIQLALAEIRKQRELKKYPRKWTPEEDQVIRENIRQMSYGQLTKLVNKANGGRVERTSLAVVNRAKVLGLRRC